MREWGRVGIMRSCWNGKATDNLFATEFHDRDPSIVYSVHTVSLYDTSGGRTSSL